MIRHMVGIMVIVCCFTLVTAQTEQPRGERHPDAVRMDQLFNQIMQTLPDGAKSRVDSASAAGKPVVGTAVERSEQQRAVQAALHQERLQGLSDELKAQVEHAIYDMEKRKAERKAEFIEQQQGKKR